MLVRNQKFFYGRRKGRKISSTNYKLVKDFSNRFYLQDDQICKLAPYKFNKNILEIGFGNGDNLLNMSLKKRHESLILMSFCMGI